jgi:hypothetical protein
MSGKFTGPGEYCSFDIGEADLEALDDSAQRNVLADRSPDGVRRRSYDRAFELAVAEGYLTVQEAWARGSRDAYIARLQRRYELTLDLAQKVADNHLSLMEALELLDCRASGNLPSWMEEPGWLRWQMLPIALLVAGGLFFLGRHSERMWENQIRVGRELERLSLSAAAASPAIFLPRGPVGSATTAPTVQREENGLVTRVSARRPSAVVEEVCRLASTDDSCAWMEVRHIQPRHHPGHRIGRFAGEAGGIWIVRIRRDRASGDWYAGTGLRPLAPIPEGGGEGPKFDPAPAHASILSRPLP